MEPTPFPSSARFRAWLLKNRARKSELVVSCAKQPETRARRFELLLECSQKGVTIPMLTRAPKRTMAGR